MNDLSRLKNRNLLETFGWFAKKNPKKALLLLIAFLMIFVSIMSIPGVIALVKKGSAEKYITQSELRIDAVSSTLSQINDRLNNKPNLYKELSLYKNDLENNYSEFDKLNSELDKIKTQFENKEVKKVLYQFKAEKDEDKVLFTDKILATENKVASLNTDTLEVLRIDNYLIGQSKVFINYENAIESTVAAAYNKLEVIGEKAKTTNVKEKSNKYFTSISDNKNKFLSGLEQLSFYTEKEQGKYTLSELRVIESSFIAQTKLLDNSDASLLTFNNYWEELNTQYYTVVTGQHSNKTTDYITEPNPSFHEWTETETYTDTETYTERVYAGSRVVGDTRTDIYETVTKTRPVTRTRTVTKNNGLPRTISVPYDVYSHYYTIEKHTPTGVTTTEEYVGKKHEKYDSMIRNWNYDNDEEVGYMVWKQLWNDNEGILRGKSISPVLE